MRSAGSGVERRARARAGAAAARRRGRVASRAVASSVSAISRNCAGLEAAAAGRALDRPARCRGRAPIPTPGRSSRSARAWSVSSSAARDDDRVVRRLERLGQPARRRERGGRRRAAPGSAGNSSRASERWSIGPVSARGGRAGRGPGSPALDEPPRLRGPRLARVVDADPRRRRSTRRRPARRPAPPRGAAATPGRTGRCPVQPVSMPERRRHEARARSPGDRPAARRSGRPAAARPVGASGSRRRVVARRTRSTRIASMPSSGSTARIEHGGGRAGRFGHDVQAVVHPVDKVHVGMPGRPEHDPVAGGLAEAGVRRPIVAADVGLDLDDPRRRAGRSRRRGRGGRRSVARAASSVGRRPGWPGRGRSEASGSCPGCCPARTGRSAGRTPG